MWLTVVKAINKGQTCQSSYCRDPSVTDDKGIRTTDEHHISKIGNLIPVARPSREQRCFHKSGDMVTKG
jgi:hypothetical protein